MIDAIKDAIAMERVPREDLTKQLVNDLMKHDTLMATAEALSVALLNIRMANGHTGISLGNTFEDHLECCMQVAEYLRDEQRP